jgi:murein DD-endopeptidase MepM/ murein hydrolase activator NlpD
MEYGIIGALVLVVAIIGVTVVGNATRSSLDQATLVMTGGSAQIAVGEFTDWMDARVASAVGAGGLPETWTGGLDRPMPGAATTQTYGCTGFDLEPPAGDCEHFHDGVDYADVLDTPIYAAAPGRVIFAGPWPFDAFPQAVMVIIAHSSHLTTHYAHLDDGGHAPVVHEGDWVDEGQLIGYEGSTGNSTGPHLHWSAMLDHAWVDPRFVH